MKTSIKLNYKFWVIVFMFLQLFVTAQTDIQMDSIKRIVELNGQKISNFKTKLPKQEIEKLIVGQWDFVNLQKQDNKIIDTLKIEYFDNEGKRHYFTSELVKRPSISFFDNFEYKMDDTAITAKSAGKWHYVDSVRALTLYYKEPYFPNPLMKTVLNLPGLISEELWIYKITSEELYLIETYPINEYEKWFNLLYYRKK